MKVYIAGPMTGYTHYNHAEFQKVARVWRNSGHEAETPFEANSRVWQKHYGRDFDPFKDKCDYGDPILPEMMEEDMDVLRGSDAIVLLNGWQDSRGAKAELAEALALGKKVFLAGFPAVETLKDETILQEAQRLVHGNRGADYGHPIEDYTRTGRMWGAILGLPDIDPLVCCTMMAAMKISRECNKHKRDNLTDLAGYAECAQMVAERQGK